MTTVTAWAASVLRAGPMRIRGGRWRLGSVLLGTVLLGAVLAVVKGRDWGLGYFVGNLSTPYLLGAFLAGRASRGGARRESSACSRPGRPWVRSI